MSVSESTSMGNPESKYRPDLSLSESISESQSVNVSLSESISASVVTSTSVSQSASMSTNVTNSENVSTPTSTTSQEQSTTQPVSQNTVASSKQLLPNTGTEASKSSALLGALAAVTGLGLFAKRRKRDDEE